jgi:hypothetical protein
MARQLRPTQHPNAPLVGAPTPADAVAPTVFPPPRETEVVPFTFLPRVPYACPPPIAFEDPVDVDRWSSYQPLAPQWRWNGVKYVYAGATPLTPPIWWVPPRYVLCDKKTTLDLDRIMITLRK